MPRDRIYCKEYNIPYLEGHSFRIAFTGFVGVWELHAAVWHVIVAGDMIQPLASSALGKTVEYPQAFPLDDYVVNSSDPKDLPYVTLGCYLPMNNGLEISPSRILRVFR